MHIIDTVYIYELIFATAQYTYALDLYLLLKLAVIYYGLCDGYSLAHFFVKLLLICFS